VGFDKECARKAHYPFGTVESRGQGHLHTESTDAGHESACTSLAGGYVPDHVETTSVAAPHGCRPGRPGRRSSGRRTPCRLLAAGALTLTLGCMSPSQFDARMSTAAAAVAADADAAHRCAADLNDLLDRNPTAVHIALTARGRTASTADQEARAWPPARLRERARELLSRRSNSIDAAGRVVARAWDAGPAALIQVFTAVENAEAERLQLCRARDVASALVDHPLGSPALVSRRP
jgi:hypothetical protein